jgi:hypothetical protein
MSYSRCNLADDRPSDVLGPRASKSPWFEALTGAVHVALTGC